jgi:hypothetical protein
MADNRDDAMTIPELLDARERVRRHLEIIKIEPYNEGGPSRDNSSEQEALSLVLEEIEAELAERGYKEVDAK